MKVEVTQEMLDKAKEAETAQELQELAKAEGIELTQEAAAEIFAKLHAQSGELSDEELENVAGGTYFKINGETGVLSRYKSGEGVITTQLKKQGNTWVPANNTGWC